MHKKHRAQYETRSHRRLVQFRNLSGPTAAAFLDYIVRLCPPGVELRIAHTTVEAPTGELAQLLGMASLPDAPSLSYEIKRVLSTKDTATLLDALCGYARAKNTSALVTMPDAVRGHVRVCAGLREVLNSDDDRIAFDSFVESGEWPQAT